MSNIEILKAIIKDYENRQGHLDYLFDDLLRKVDCKEGYSLIYNYMCSYKVYCLKNGYFDIFYSQYGKFLLKGIKCMADTKLAENEFNKISDESTIKTKRLDELYALRTRAYLFGKNGEKKDIDLALNFYTKIKKDEDIIKEVDFYLYNEVIKQVINEQYDRAKNYSSLIKTRDVAMYNDLKKGIGTSKCHDNVLVAKILFKGIGIEKNISMAVELSNRVSELDFNLSIDDMKVLIDIYSFTNDITKVNRYNYFLKQKKDSIYTITTKKDNSSNDTNYKTNYSRQNDRFTIINNRIIFEKTDSISSIDINKNMIYYLDEYYSSDTCRSNNMDKYWTKHNVLIAVKEGYYNRTSIKGVHDSRYIPNYYARVGAFCNLVSSYLGGEWVICLVPGHDPKIGIKSSIPSIIKYASLSSSFSINEKLIIRSSYAEERHSSLYRTEDVDEVLSTLDVGVFLRGKNVIILDDITTTGTTLMACKRLLIERGIAKRVICLAFGRTT